MSIDWINEVLDTIPEMAWDPRQGLKVEREKPHLVPEPEALSWLEEYLYAHCYAHWNSNAFQSSSNDDEELFVEQLLLATSRAYYWDPGWIITSVFEGGAFATNERVQVFIDDLSRVFPSTPRKGEVVNLKIPCSWPNLSPGFFYLFGPNGLFPKDCSLMRFYLNIAPEYASELLATLLDVLGPEGVRFEAKVAKKPDAYRRVDPAVIYAAVEGVRSIQHQLIELSYRHPEWWREGIPLFTKQLAKGLAMAESPRFEPGKDRQSFGAHRCRLLAQGILDALQKGYTQQAACRDCVERAFWVEGIDPKYPYAQVLPIETFDLPPAHA
ncbi:MAG TPA: hypothetical protein DD435_13720 [Cyanobacteria bacterium UBA8530]|nr:hypothetical protein [Cyanobacteria bacterium UBA8530]